MPELPLREKAGQELANRILMTKKRRKTADKAVGDGSSSNNSIGGGVISNVFAANTGFGQTSLERLHSMSPAAQLLATSKLGLAKLADRSLQASYSPMMSPSVRSGGGLGRTPTPQLLHPLVTPSPSALSSNLTPGTTKQRRIVNLSATSASSSSTTSARRNQSSSSSSSSSKKRPNASDFF